MNRGSVRHLIYIMGCAMEKRLKNDALELRMHQVVMCDVCRMIAKFFFDGNHGLVLTLFSKILTANLSSVVFRFIIIMMLCLKTLYIKIHVLKPW